MITRIKSDLIVLPGGITSGYVYFEDGVITAVGTEELAFGKEYDFTGRYVSPGFIDIHTHGGGGYDFSESKEDVIGAANFHLYHGTTSIMPTVSAAPIEYMEKAAEYADAAIGDERLLPNIIGVHLEGPYLSLKQSGAQSPSFITPPDRKKYLPVLEKWGKIIKRVTYAPENDEGYELTRALAERGIVASAGHTDATVYEMVGAIECGCSLVTHLYSCTSTVVRKGGFRYPGVLETALLRDDIYAEIIADGKHLPYELIRLVIKAKGSDKVALITDSLSLAGVDIEETRMGAYDVIVEDGVIKLKDRSAFAGSIATADRLIRVVTDAGIPLYEAVKMLTKVPAEIMGLNKGVLAEGRDADIIVFDDGVNVKDIFVGGKKIV